MRNPSDVGYADHSQARTFRCPWRTDTPMRLTIALLGLELDITLGPAGADDEPDTGAALNGGTAASTPISFTASWPTPEDVPLPQRTPAWDEPEELR